MHNKNNPININIAPIIGPLTLLLTLFQINHHQGAIHMKNAPVKNTHIIGPVINNSIHAISLADLPYQKTINAE